MSYAIERWGADDDGWNLETGGHPGIALVGNAIQVWVTFQDAPGDGSVSVAQAAAAFNIEPIRAIEAVQQHHWMYLVGPHDDYTRLMIFLDGE